MITLEQLLESRDRRAEHQRSLLEAHPDRVLLCLTVQLPGPEKRNAVSLKIADAGLEAVRQAFAMEYEEVRDLETGFEGYFVVPGNPLEAKRRACQIEDQHPLGRLMDIDVLVSAEANGIGKNIFPGGTGKTNFPEAIANPTHADAVMPIGREEIGLEPRRCLLCGLPARVCMRAHRHSQVELLAEIQRRVDSYNNC